MITIRAKKLTSFLETTRGHMFSKNIHPISFETRFGIHTFFVKHPIDVLILDDKNIVRKITYGLKPWKLFFWKPQWSRVIELPNGSVKKQNITIGTKILLQETLR